jgi:hypothetical protein
MRNRAAILICVLLASCASTDVSPQVERPTADNLIERVDAICSDELIWQFPNSMAQTLSDDGREMRLDLVRARVLLETRDLARNLDEQQRVRLLTMLGETPADEQWRALAYARLLAAAGVPESRISAARPSLQERQVDLWNRTIREGLALRELS